MNIIERLERLPLGSFHYRLLIIIGIGWMFDSMDTGIISFVLPSLAKAWNLDNSQVSWIVSIGLVGMALGAVLAGFVADRIGRRTTLVVTLGLYSIATGLCGLAWDYTSLMVFRFLVGFGLGGHLPVAGTLVSEYSPAPVRGRMIVLLESFWAFGWLVAAVVAYLIIPQYGWNVAFFIGAAPLLYLPFLFVAVPESIRYLTEKGQLTEAHRILVKLEHQLGCEPVREIQAPKTEARGAVSVAELWSPSLLRRTLSLWVLWFGIVFSYYGIFTWLPTLMYGQGHTLVKTFEYVLIMTVAQIPGYYAAAYLVDKIGRKPTLGIFLFMSAVSAYFFGQSTVAAQIIIWGCLLSFFNLGAWGIVYTYTPEVYPTRLRASGSGWAAGVGRIGGIFAPLTVAWLLNVHLGYPWVFGMFAAVLIVTALCIVLFGEETRGRKLDEISH